MVPLVTFRKPSCCLHRVCVTSSYRQRSTGMFAQVKIRLAVQSVYKRQVTVQDIIILCLKLYSRFYAILKYIF